MLADEINEQFDVQTWIASLPKLTGPSFKDGAVWVEEIGGMLEVALHDAELPQFKTLMKQYVSYPFNNGRSAYLVLPLTHAAVKIVMDLAAELLQPVLKTIASERASGEGESIVY